jgi:hypothetical protein
MRTLQFTVSGHFPSSTLTIDALKMKLFTGDKLNEKNVKKTILESHSLLHRFTSDVSYRVEMV